MKAEKSDGMLVYAAQRSNQFGDFLSLLLVNGSLVYSYSLGSEEQVTALGG